MKAAILIPVLANRDAVGADALTMASVFERNGLETRIFCISAHDVAVRTYPAHKLNAFVGPDDIVVYHFSMGWAKGLDLLRRCPARLFVKYHNITPPEFFHSISHEHEEACRDGRAEIAAVAALGCERYIGDSAYNLDELFAAGAPRASGSVLAPFHRIDDLLEAEADAAMLDELGDGARNFLMVGRIAPNKGHVDLVDAFAAYLRAYAEPARLVLVGKIDPRLSAYTNAVRARVAAYGIEKHVRWVDGASESELKAAYLASHVFMLLSAHEGFCVPLVEAMALGTPIVARATTAVPETLGSAGIAWNSADPFVYAATAARLFSDAVFRDSLREQGMRRYREQFRNDRLGARLLELVEQRT
ncbi:MAG TPA: glycosyltransferase [Dokdonella sp.]|uniref:glycosyltransferase n=1 Tax=Dokdonella sp. TaxID=2291710 RepID=UPI0025BB7848|nr:glycosyltransferase [Dokdonella sp.]MBX3691151.1 glycosyltransferase [Dokdonella sp.]MCW5566849.1 glycosyltransferase [Dokdonella sp.]HNR91107.1 glycosyltransferase [Dokdonella sp.]